MSETRRCSRCGKPLSDRDDGLCPACLVQLGLDAAGETTIGAPPSMTSDGATVLGPPTPTAAGTPNARDRQSGDRIGPYRLMRVLGEGGMGVVYLAEQTEPITRIVALKLIKLGMDTREVVARFEAERQTLALMDHPNIASVLDAGATADGRPYFVMEYAPGVPITEYCDAHQLTTSARLGLFITVCAAVQHAHQKGIIHRDLKPSNVLVIEQDGQPVPKVIDFGIAKATDQRMSERTQFTQHGLLVGTPEYMSPEQTDPTTVDLDTRTDIYALGVVLYELLVGGLPFSPTRLREAGYTELLRIIREEEPPRPSSRLTSLGATATDVAARRHTKPPTLAGELRGDLDWITLKALEKDRARRYGSASEFAADLTRYLQHEPVVARPPSASYRVGKFVRRNRLAVVATALVATAVVAGLIVSSVLYVQEGRARREADTARLEASARAVSEARQRTVAEAATEAETRARLQADAQRVRADESSAEAIRQRTAAQYESDAAVIAAAGLEQRGGQIMEASERLEHVPAARREWEWDYLRRLTRLPDWLYRSQAVPGQRVSTARTSSGETYGYLGSFAFSPDGREVIWCDQLSVQRWDLQTRIRSRVDGPFRWILAVSSDGMQVANRPKEGTSANESTTVDLFRTYGAERSFVLGGHDGDVTVAAFSPDGQRLAVGTSTGSVFIWSTGNGRLVGRTLLPSEPIRAVEFSHDGRQVVLTSSRAIRIIDSDTRQVLKDVDRGAVMAHFSRDGHRLLVALADSRATYGATNDSRDMNDVARRYGGAGALSRTVAVLDVETGQIQATFPQAGQVVSMALSPDTSVVAVTVYRNEGFTLATLDVASASTIAVTPVVDYETKVTPAVAFTPDGARLLIGGTSIISRPWGLNTPATRATATTALAFSDDGRTLVSGHKDGSVRLWTLDGHAFMTLLGHEAAVDSVAVLPDRRAVSASEDNTIRLWDVDTGRTLRTIPVPNLQAYSLTAVAHGRWFAVEDARTIVLFASQSGDVVDRIASPADFSGFAFDAGGDRVGMMSARAKAPDPTLWIWDRRLGRTIASGRPLESVDGLAFDPNGSHIALSGLLSVSLWSTELTTRRFEVSMPVAQFISGNDLRFTPDGRRLLTRDRQSGVVGVRDASNGRLLLTLEGAAASWAVSADGQHLAIGDKRGFLRMCDLPPTREQMARDAIATIAQGGSRFWYEISERLSGKTSLSPDVREAAIRLAAEEVDNPADINTASRMVVATRGSSLEEYRTALRRAEMAVKLSPSTANYTTTLGLALYRLGQYQKCIDTLDLSVSPQTRSAIVAMARFRLGQIDEARRLLNTVRAGIAQAGADGRTVAADLTALVAEASTLIDGRQSVRRLPRATRSGLV